MSWTGQTVSDLPTENIHSWIWNELGKPGTKTERGLWASYEAEAHSYFSLWGDWAGGSEDFFDPGYWYQVLAHFQSNAEVPLSKVPNPKTLRAPVQSPTHSDTSPINDYTCLNTLYVS